MMEYESSMSIEGNIVGLKSTNAVILATDSNEYEMYLIDDRIYCCAPRSGIDRKIVLEVSSKVEQLVRDRGQTVTVSQVRDMFCDKYQNAESPNVLIAGQDSKGLHLFSMESGKSRMVIYAAKGTDAENIVGILSHDWSDFINLSEAEHLARKALMCEDAEMCTIYRAKEIEEQGANMDFNMDVDPSVSPASSF
ncbi:uncharacterized protein LOC6735836 [Drosophila simulans]|uniref:Uncharacterized protein n=1 Tax=Drosophila simulans TaxID=7240 RepID=A0A0J9RJ14_DROSI|nr:uncharacterized protein LOC6735836 [Drosophila simulans]XP_044778472.1 uncharacterized protein LOC6735836 [Drosophila simulans]KMY95983.1 uncharacterized protein Dsimw501_GD25072 [Drosophila simulans]